ncbi:ABC transporter substrate-binding protein [Paenibacillus sp. IB182496]|uniref:ABC transporter substrate-binding protein n=2 Tax=Paenibacillus sabuli TaxID=2772509 RepID=A0A927BU09_9BACL|nr:ABC transporter substrate-binding protein [Paenibacillus sabuli]
MMAVLAACGSDTTTNNDASNGNANTEQGQQAAPGNAQENEDDAQQAETGEATSAAYPLTVTDATGTELTFEEAPTTIVSLVPSETEILFALGAGEEVAGVDEWSNYPEAALDKPKVGDMSTNIEAVSALNPDLVVASSTMNTAAIEQLRELDVQVFASDPKTLDEVIAHIGQVGDIIGRTEEAAEVTAHMQEVRTQVETAIEGADTKRVYLEFSPNYSVGKGEFLDELITIAGGENIASDQQGWFEIDAETILQRNPEVIIYPDFGADNSIPELIASRPGWEEIDAVKNDELHAVTNDPLVRVGPRLTDGLLELAKAIHPELFN